MSRALYTRDKASERKGNRERFRPPREQKVAFESTRTCPYAALSAASTWTAGASGDNFGSAAVARVMRVCRASKHCPMKKKLKTAVSTESQATMSLLDRSEAGEELDICVADAVVELPVTLPSTVTFPPGQLGKGARMLPLTEVQLTPTQPCGMSLMLGAEFASSTVAVTPPKGEMLLHGQLVQPDTALPPSSVNVPPMAGSAGPPGVSVHSSTERGAASIWALELRLVDAARTTSAQGK